MKLTKSDQNYKENHKFLGVGVTLLPSQIQIDFNTIYCIERESVSLE